MVTYLVVPDVIAIHAEVMYAMGDTPTAVRDERGLESALLRPQMAADYERADLVRQAAILAVGISQVHAFLDGNKRTAYMATDSFFDRTVHVSPASPLKWRDTSLWSPNRWRIVKGQSTASRPGCATPCNRSDSR